MTALTKSREDFAKYVDGQLYEYAIKASETIYAGSLVNLVPSTGLVEAGDSTDGDKFVGVAFEEVSSDANKLDANGNTAYVKVYKNGCFKFNFAGAEITDVGKIVSISDDNTVVHALPTVTVNPTGTNNSLTYTAKVPYEGERGKAITIQYIDPGAASKSERCDVSDSGITIWLATNGSSVITSTGDTIKATIAAHTVANALVTVADAGSDDGSGAVTAMAASRLTIGPACGRIVGIESTSEVFVDITGFAH